MKVIVHPGLAAEPAKTLYPIGKYGWMWKNQFHSLLWHGVAASIDEESKLQTPRFMTGKFGNILFFMMAEDVKVLYLQEGNACENSLTDMELNLGLMAGTKGVSEILNTWWLGREEVGTAAPLGHLPPVPKDTFLQQLRMVRPSLRQRLLQRMDNRFN